MKLNENKEISFNPTIEKFKSELTSLLLQLENTINELPAIKSPLADFETPSISFEVCIEQIKEKKSEIYEYFAKKGSFEA